MNVYHMSETLRLGDELIPDHQHCTNLAQPFTQALERSEDCFYSMVLCGKYLRSVLGRSGLREWSNFAKWSVEGAFEYIRKTEFPHLPSRLRCNYFYDSLPCCKLLFDYDWGGASPEEQAAVRLFEVDLQDERPLRLDMRLYDAAYDAMGERQDVQAVLGCARDYFAGKHSADPVWELLSAQPAKAVRDLTAYLKGE